MSCQVFNKNFFQHIFFATIVIAMTGCTSSPEPEWQKLNQELISEHNLKVRNLSGLPANNIESNLKDGQVTNLDQVDSIDLAPGVKAKIFWGTGTMVSVVELAPNAKIPKPNCQLKGLPLFLKVPSTN